MPLFGRTGRRKSRQDESACVCVLMCLYATCHVAVYQLWSDGSTAVHIDEIVTRRVAFVFVCLTGLLVYRWVERDRAPVWQREFMFTLSLLLFTISCFSTLVLLSQQRWKEIVSGSYTMSSQQHSCVAFLFSVHSEETWADTRNWGCSPPPVSIPPLNISL